MEAVAGDVLVAFHGTRLDAESCGAMALPLAPGAAGTQLASRLGDGLAPSSLAA